jgi:hypothetical protein
MPRRAAHFGVRQQRRHRHLVRRSSRSSWSATCRDARRAPSSRLVSRVTCDATHALAQPAQQPRAGPQRFTGRHDNTASDARASSPRWQADAPSLRGTVAGAFALKRLDASHLTARCTAAVAAVAPCSMDYVLRSRGSYSLSSWRGGALVAPTRRECAREVS